MNTLLLDSAAVVSLARVNYSKWRKGHREIPGASPEVAAVVRQNSSWAAVHQHQLKEAPCAAQLVPVHHNITDTFYWSRSIDAHPTTICETAAIVRHLAEHGNTPSLVCLGTLWAYQDKLHYISWRAGRAELFPFDSDLGEDFVCPVRSSNAYVFELPANPLQWSAPVPKVDGFS